MPLVKLNRVFCFKDLKLPDPNPTYTLEEVVNHYAAQYPELNNCVIPETGDIVDDKEIHYNLETNLGTKG